MSSGRWEPRDAPAGSDGRRHADPVSRDDGADDDTTAQGQAYFARHGFWRNVRTFDPQQTRRRLADIIEQAGICARIVADGRAALDADSFESLKTRMAAARSIEILSEAAAKLHSDYKEHFPEVGWRNLYRMRTLAVHHYDRVRDGLVWAAITANVPELVAALNLPESPDMPIPLPADLHR